MNWRNCLLLAGIAGLLSAPMLRADVVVLKSGGRVEGELLKADETARDGFYIVKTTAGGMLRLDKIHVDHVERLSDAERKYAEYLPKMPDTIDGHWTMAEWCRTNGLKAQREYHLQRIIERDPDHEEARHGLGYSKLDDRWIRADEWMHEQGYVRYQGAWRTRQEVALDQQQEKFDLAAKNWRRDLKMWRNWFGNERRQAEGIANIKAVNDPLAALALGEMLEDEPLRSMKLLYVEILGRLNSSAAKTPLIKAAVEDNDDVVREACLRELQKNGTKQAVGVFIRALDPKKQPDNLKINRAGIALSWMKDDDAIKPLIEALVTEHKIKVSGGGGGGLGPIGASFGGPSGGGGMGGLSAGKKPSIILQKVPNEGVLYALKQLTNVDYRYDQDTWKAWYARSRTPQNVSLRRDG